MTVNAFLIIFAACSVLTSLITEAIKKVMKGTENSDNLVALIVAIFVGCGTTVLYYLHSGIEFTVLNCVYILIVGLLNWVGATVGYDKVKQMIEQLTKPKEDEV